jgi:hypothetical protein
VFLNGVYESNFLKSSAICIMETLAEKHTGIARHCYPGSGVLQVYDKLNTVSHVLIPHLEQQERCFKLQVL